MGVLKSFCIKKIVKPKIEIGADVTAQWLLFIYFVYREGKGSG